MSRFCGTPCSSFFQEQGRDFIQDEYLTDSMRKLYSESIRELSGEGMREFYANSMQEEENFKTFLVFKRQNYERKNSCEESSLNLDSGFWDRETVNDILANSETNQGGQMDDCKDKSLNIDMLVLNTLV